MTDVRKPEAEPEKDVDVPPVTRRSGLSRRPLTAGILAGIVSGAISLGVAEVVAGIVSPSAAPLIALGDVAVDQVPPWLKDFAVQNFGRHDKQVLLGGALLIALLLSALAGVLAVRGQPWGTYLVLGLGGLAALAAATRPDSGSLSVLPSLVGALVGMVVLNWIAPQVRLAVAAPAGTRSAEVTSRRALLALGS